MIKAFKHHLSTLQLGEKPSVLLAVSGGVDSMVMLQLFHLSGHTPFAVAACNFGLRDEADEEIAFIEKTCAQLKIRFYSKKFETATHAQTEKMSIQLAARELRYAWFEQLCAQEGFDFIATAHHKNDHAETVLMNIARGTGIKGLLGIPVQRDQIIRPMLFAWKQEILEFANKHQIEYREDASNTSDKYTRNHVRLNLIPALEKVNPEALKHIDQLTQYMSFLEGEIEVITQSMTSQWVKNDGETVQINISEYSSWPLKQEVFYRMISALKFPSGVAREALTLIEAQTGKRVEFEDYQIWKDRQHLVIGKSRDVSSEVWFIEHDLNVAGLPFKLQMSRVKPEQANYTLGENHGWIDEDSLEFPLILERWQSGDKIRPLGMRGKQKISDLLTQLKLSPLEKKEVYVLKSNGSIVWVVGHKVSEDFKVRTFTETVIHFEYS